MADKTTDASALIDALLADLPDWRGRMLTDIRRIIQEADPDIAEEWKWMGTPTWSHNGIVCIANPFKDKVKVTFYAGAQLADPDGLFNNGLDGNQWRTIDYFKDDVIRESEFRALVKSAVEYNLNKPKSKASAKKKAE